MLQCNGISFKSLVLINQKSFGQTFLALKPSDMYALHYYKNSQKCLEYKKQLITTHLSKPDETLSRGHP